MAVRTVRLDPETEHALRDVRNATGWPISDVLKRGVHAVRLSLGRGRARPPYEVFRELDLGPGGYAVAPSTDTRRGVKAALTKRRAR